VSRDDVFKLSEAFLDAYDADDDGVKLNALRTRLGITGPCVLAGLLEYYAANR
jgi:hypothetical protein